MQTRSLLALSALTLATVASTAAAQVITATSGSSSPPATVFDVTPYIGYMVFGSFLDGPVGTNIGTANGAVYGAQASIAMSPNIALVGNLAYASSDLRIGLPFIGGISVGTSNLLLYDADLQLSMPMTGSPLKPFVQGGVGAMHYDISSGPLTTSSTNLAFNVGGGIDYQISPMIGFRAMVKDYVGKFDFNDATNLDIQGKTTNNFSLVAGLKLSF